jgi:hypothetical protein
MKDKVIVIVSSDGPANVGDLLVSLCPVGDMAVGYRSRLAVAGAACAQRETSVRKETLAHISAVIAGFGREA